MQNTRMLARRAAWGFWHPPGVRVDTAQEGLIARHPGTLHAQWYFVVNLFSDLTPLHAALDYHLERHNVLTTNIAHVDTPGYVPRDLARVENPDFSSALNVAMTGTHPAHLHLSSSLGPTAGRVFEDRWEGAGNDHNYVSMDREAAKLAANQIRYDVTSAIITAELGELAFAAHDGRT